jgi:hypothetical protein
VVSFFCCVQSPEKKAIFNVKIALHKSKQKVNIFLIKLLWVLTFKFTLHILKKIKKSKDFKKFVDFLLDKTFCSQISTFLNFHLPIFHQVLDASLCRHFSGQRSSFLITAGHPNDFAARQSF